MTVGNAENVKTEEAMIETVARALYAEAQAEALRVHPTDQPLPSFDEDEEHSRAFCLNMARAAITAMQAAPPPDDPEPPKDDEDEYGPDREETDGR